MLRAVKEAFARRINRDQQAAGHVWEGRYHDVALIDAGGVLACLVYVDLNPFRAGLAQDPAASAFCSARHRRSVDAQAPDAPLGQRLCAIAGHPLLDADGQELGSWSWNAADVADLAAATARLIRDGQGRLPDWAEELLPRLGIARARWGACMAAGGMITGNVLGNQTSRRIHAGTGRLPSDKSQLFAND
jgi:hypothetical protein